MGDKKAILGFFSDIGTRLLCAKQLGTRNFRPTDLTHEINAPVRKMLWLAIYALVGTTRSGKVENKGR